MELPKNITQIGEADDKCKIYVEDYVVSYLRQMNQLARNKEMALALYGTSTDEEDKTYVFLYGAARVNYLQKEVRHLSQAQKQEIESNRVRYFNEYSFQGYCVLNGEMIEGFYICSQDICRFTKGYAQFYEKNECMLAYMLEMRQEEPAQEMVDREKYERVRKRQEERKSRFGQEMEKKTGEKKLEWFPKDRFKNLQFSVVASFAILCVLGLLAISGGQGTGLFTPDSETEDAREVAGEQVQAQVLSAQDSLIEALQQENRSAEEKTEDKTEDTTEDATEDTTEDTTGDTTEDTSEEPEEDTEESSEQVPEEKNTEQNPEQPVEASVEEAVASPVSTVQEETTPREYTIQKGDTLNRISLRLYGSKSYVKQICELNQIEDADHIRIGEKILLP